MALNWSNLFLKSIKHADEANDNSWSPLLDDNSKLGHEDI